MFALGAVTFLVIFKFGFFVFALILALGDHFDRELQVRGREKMQIKFECVNRIIFDLVWD